MRIDTIATTRATLAALASGGRALLGALLGALLLAVLVAPAMARAADATPGRVIAAGAGAAADDDVEDEAEAEDPRTRDADGAASEEGEDDDAGAAAPPRVTPPSAGNPVERSLQPPDSRARPGRAAGLPGAR